MPTKTFQVALVNRVPKNVEYFSPAAQNIITYTLWEHLVSIARFIPEGLIPGPRWNLRPGQLQSFDVVVYFVLDPSSSLAGTSAPNAQEGRTAGGRTALIGGGVLSEVYVDGNMPARRLGNIALHEIMHNKRDVGTRVISNLHAKGGGGLATPPTNEWTPFTPANAKLMAQHIFSNIRQYTAAM